MSDDATSTEGAGEPANPEEGSGEQEADSAAAVKALEADAKKWKSIALKHEETAKANATAAQKLRDLELEGKSETEKLQVQLDEARAEARTSKVQALRHQVASEKGLPPSLAKFLPDVDNEVDMVAAAEELMEAAAPGAVPATRQPKSQLLTPLHDEDDRSRDQLLAAMQGRPST